MKQSGFLIEGQLSNGQWRLIRIAKTFEEWRKAQSFMKASLNTWRIVWCDNISDYDWKRCYRGQSNA